jgi:hypothetical protein
MLCYAMLGLCYACYAMPCHAMLCYAGTAWRRGCRSCRVCR